MHYVTLYIVSSNHISMNGSLLPPGWLYTVHSSVVLLDKCAIHGDIGGAVPLMFPHKLSDTFTQY